MDQGRINIISHQTGNCYDFGIVHDNGVTLCMAAALCISDQIGLEYLF